MMDKCKVCNKRIHRARLPSLDKAIGSHECAMTIKDGKYTVRDWGA